MIKYSLATDVASSMLEVTTLEGHVKINEGRD